MPTTWTAFDSASNLYFLVDASGNFIVDVDWNFIQVIGIDTTVVRAEI